MSIEKEYERDVVAQGMLDSNDGVYVEYWLGMAKADASEYLYISTMLNVVKSVTKTIALDDHLS